MKKQAFLLLAFLAFATTSFAQAPPLTPNHLVQIEVQHAAELVDLQFNNPTQKNLTMVLRGVDGHVVFKKKWKNERTYHGQFKLTDFPNGTYLLEVQSGEQLISRDRIVVDNNFPQ